MSTVAAKVDVGPVRQDTASASEVSFALYFVDSQSYDNIRATDNGS